MLSNPVPSAESPSDSVMSTKPEGTVIFALPIVDVPGAVTVRVYAVFVLTDAEPGETEALWRKPVAADAEPRQTGQPLKLQPAPE